ncbi:MAG: hypothetical protein AAGK78_09160 [Planctomycetota bacterium]
MSEGSTTTAPRGLAALASHEALRTPRVILAGLVAFVGFYFFGDLIDYPADERFEPALLRQDMGLAKVLLLMLGLAAMTLLGTALAGKVRYDAGWAAAVAGLIALRLRAGESFHAFQGSTRSVFVLLAVELVVLAIIAGAMWTMLHVLRERGTTSPWLKRWLELPTPAYRLADRKASSDDLGQQIMALLAHTGITAVIVLLLCRSDAKAQVLASVAIASFAGSFVVQGNVIATRPAAWFLAGPVLCGLIGYLYGFLASTPTDLALGRPSGPLAALARPMPLDWIAAGVPASLWAYVNRRTHQLNSVMDVMDAGEPSNANAAPVAESNTAPGS